MPTIIRALRWSFQFLFQFSVLTLGRRRWYFANDKIKAIELDKFAGNSHQYSDVSQIIGKIISEFLQSAQRSAQPHNLSWPWCTVSSSPCSPSRRAPTPARTATPTGLHSRCDVIIIIWWLSLHILSLSMSSRYWILSFYLIDCKSCSEYGLNANKNYFEFSIIDSIAGGQNLYDGKSIIINSLSCLRLPWTK